MRLYCGDCLELLAQVPTGSVDLIVTDPPYQIDSTKGGGGIGRKMKNTQDELAEKGIVSGFDGRILNEMMRVCKVPNIYLWCNAKQIPMYLDFFVKKHKCNFDILVWVKTNAVPAFSNKYLTDKEYCLYFRRGGYCKPTDYGHARTAWFQPINLKDKKMYNHPTIKPLNIIETLVANSSREGDMVLDPFMGSGTTGVACANLGRDFVGIELKEDYFRTAEQRIQEAEMSIWN